jgi:hypothetical protein
VLDRYLAHKAVEGQQTPRPVPYGRRDNLDKPITDLHRTRGSFGAESGSWAPLVIGEFARVGVVAAIALTGFALGAAVGLFRARPARRGF